jgi:rfaE bifunctional protein kinase chain/domain
MELIEATKSWKNKKIAIIGEALIDRYILGNADSISPDAPVPNVRISKVENYIGAIGLVLQYILSLGGKAEIFTMVGNDFEGEYFMKKIKELGLNLSGILINDDMNTPQITRIKAMNQHLLRLEAGDPVENITEKGNELLSVIETNMRDVDCIIVLDYGATGLFNDSYVQLLLKSLQKDHSNVPIIARPNTSNYYVYEDVTLLKINLQKALQNFSIDCCNDTSVNIAGKRILNSTKSGAIFLNYLESESYLFLKGKEKVEKFMPLIRQPVRSFVAVGSAIMAVLGLTYASGVDPVHAVKTSLHAAALSAITPPVQFFNLKTLQDFIKS